MKTIEEIINEALDQGITLFVVDNQLQYETRCDSIAPELINEWESHKQEIVNFLNDLESKKKNQTSKLQGDVLEKQLIYWQKQLSGIPLLHHFPLDNPRPEQQRFEGRMYSQCISKKLTQAINSQCIKHNVTLFTFLETAFAVLINRYSNEKDIVIGTTLTKKTHHDVEPLIGFSANSLVIRTDLSGRPTFSALLKQNSRTILDAYAHQDLPFEKLVEKISPERNLNHNPVFQIIFTVQNNQQDTTMEQDNIVPDEEKSFLTTRFDLEVHVYENEKKGELSILWIAETSLFSRDTIDRLLVNYETLLTSIVRAMSVNSANKEPTIDKLPLLGDAEKHTLLHEFNGPQTQYQRDRCFHELFEEQVTQNAEKTALVFGESTLSYRELNEQANQLAHYLIEQGIQPDTLVAICLPRTLQVAVTLLGILKAGGAYVPLDISYPKARLQYMLEHSGAEFILTETHLVNDLPLNQQNVICLDTPEIQLHLKKLPIENITERLFPLTENHLAYVIYTSGSTGRPKGAMLEHKGWVNLVHALATVFGACSNIRGLQFASWSFDIAILEMSMTLAYGATLYLISETQRRSPELLDAIIEKYHITHAVLPPALLPHLDFNKWRNVSTLFLAGEAVPPHIATQWSQDRKLFNAYGPTECTSIITCGLLTADKRVTIGKPLPNAVMRIMDSDGNLVPLGAEGELHIGGVQLARGYRNAPELTEKQFICDPFSTNPADKLYRTGDLVRWTLEGELEFIGRIDSQVKIRSHRIELGEIESVLAGQDILSSAAVITDGNNEDKKLIAYVCPSTAWLAEKATAFNADYLESWTKIFDDQYRQTTTENVISDKYDTDSDFGGWMNSYTNQPIPREQMEEWRTGTMKRIDSLHPRRLLEIGCGTGLLLYRYAEQCESVLATDISAEVLARHQYILQQRGWSHVQLCQGDALNLGMITPDMFDTVVINSVVQYFPNVQYLDKVLAQLLLAVEAEGKILLGDIRNLDLLTAHVTAIEQSHMGEQRISVGTLANRIQRRLQQEEEFLLSPTYFAQLPTRYPEIGRVDILVKRGVGDNEMLRYRYDVILHKKGENTQSSGHVSFTWYDFVSFENLRDMLQREEQIFGVSGIPNARVKDDLALAEGLRHWPANQFISSSEQVGNFSSQSVEQIQSLELLLQYAEQFGYQCGMTWSQQQPDLLDIIFSRGPLPQIQARSDYSQTHLANYPQISSISGELSEFLESALKKQLPKYMVPSLYIPLESMPLTLNNKVDKRALPIPDENNLRKQNYIAPRNEVEEKLGELWKKHLKIKKIGIHDNFFSLGGHSLQATSLISSIRNELKVEVPLRSVFEHPTLEQLAQIVTVGLIKDKKEGNQLNSMKAIQRNGGATHYPVSFAQQRIWLIDQLEEGSAHYNCVGDFRLRESLNISAFEGAVIQVIERHEALRTQFKMIDNDPRQIISTAYHLPITYYELSMFSETEKKEQVKHLRKEEENLLFNLGTDLMLRIRVLKLAENDHIIIYNIHHIACDSWSIEIFVRELLTIYRAYCQGDENPLPALKVQYTDYAQWQRSWLQGEVLEKQLAYWQKQLSGIPLLHHFPLDNPRPEQQNFEGRMYTQRISKKLTQAINSQCIKHNVTLFMFLETAFAVLIGRYSNEKDIVIGTALAGRTHHDTEPLIGFFVNTLPIRTDLSGQPTFSELLKHNRDTILNAYTHQDLPFQMLVEKINLVRKSNYNPIIQIAFTLENIQQDTTLEHDTSIELEERPLLKSRFDLEVQVYEEKDGELRLVWIADTSLFNSVTIDRLLANYETLLIGIIEAMETCLVHNEPSVHQLPLLATCRVY
ncbi:non-ribosomal peptide synthetase [Xenorhabdus sp. IM139775]|uniref:non-ribosomal peptide synthetase n=1 Tax=Xenorhabdus sp. IM139775 TaxID=3025876 RepID=UPI002358118C|nr:non-ribosomal peptide synthetase [Xenorhabdus sp. IM139775]MDC9594431.1 amino acid adenylation domain-containing protein [Xenorhabdus sp. IM139775]